MTATAGKASTAQDKAASIQAELKKTFPDVEAYALDRYSIRMRITDARFQGLSEPERDRLLRPHLEALPDDWQADITMLLLVAPGEEGNFLAMYEFDHPSRPQL